MLRWNVFIFSTMVACNVQMTMKVSDHRYDLVVKGQCQIYLNSILITARNANSSSVLDGECSYLAQWLFLVYR